MKRWDGQRVADLLSSCCVGGDTWARVTRAIPDNCVHGRNLAAHIVSDDPGVLMKFFEDKLGVTIITKFVARQLVPKLYEAAHQAGRCGCRGRCRYLYKWCRCRRRCRGGAGTSTGGAGAGAGEGGAGAGAGEGGAVAVAVAAAAAGPVSAVSDVSAVREQQQLLLRQSTITTARLSKAAAPLDAVHSRVHQTERTDEIFGQRRPAASAARAPVGSRAAAEC